MTDTKTDGAYKGGNGNYFFDVATLEGVEAGKGYAPTVGPVVEGELTQVGVMVIPAGQSSDPHTHPDEQWIYLMSGRMLAVVDGVEKEIGPGDLMYIPANIVHNVEVMPGEDAQFFTCKDLRSGIVGTRVD